MRSSHHASGKILGIIFPIFNEQNVIEEFLGQLDNAIEEISDSVDIKFVAIDNGSTDRTLEILLNAKVRNATMQVVSLTRNFGYEIAFEVGLKEFEFDFYCLLDSDGEDPVELLPKFFDGLNQGFDVSYGLRQLRHESKLNQLFRKIFYRILRKIADDPFRVDVGEFSMFTAQVRNALIKENNSYPFWRSSISRTGFKSLAFPHERNPRIGGKSHHNKLKMLKFALVGVLSTTTWPLRFSVYCNLLVSLMTFLFCILYFFIDITAVYFLALGISYGLTFSFTLSSIAMYLARTYKNSLNRPNYYIQDFYQVENKLIKSDE